jgi:hypothetical protein
MVLDNQLLYKSKLVKSNLIIYSSKNYELQQKYYIISVIGNDEW